MKYILGLVMIVAAAFPVFAQQQQDPFGPFINVAGEGKATAEPDTASMVVGVTIEAATALDAMRRMNNAMGVVFNKLTGDFKIDQKDLCTSQLNLAPKFEIKDQHQRQVGFVATNKVIVKIHNLNTIGAVMDAVVVKDGANKIDGINFYVSNPEKVLDKARAEAMADAKRKARLYCTSLGSLVSNKGTTSRVYVSGVRSISESNVHLPRYDMRMLQMNESSSFPSSIAAGEHEFRVTMNVVFRIDEIITSPATKE